MLKYILAAITTLIVSTAYADVTYNKDTHTVSISGYTTHEQADKLYHIFKDNEVAVAILSGPGGDYYAGLKMGNMIANEKLTVIVKERTACISACAFMALAGEKIVVDGSVWFHAPYFSQAPTDVTMLQLAHKFGEGYIDMATYLLKRGTSIYFARQIITQTSKCKFIVMTGGEALMDLKKAETALDTVYYANNIISKCKR
jgi:hypothetical protein